MQTDPIADFLTRIRNASMAEKEKVETFHSKILEDIAWVLVEEGYLEGYQVIERNGKKFLELHLRYSPNGEKVITHLERVSKPGLRMYVKKDEIPRVLRGLGICILSTSRGVMVGREAKRVGVGGEVLCYIW